ncbi:MAG: thioredoxin domain-containing protein [Gammaproteobacteria bacterium]|nr:thioredoxin domain-containing protein [Gammaproteobacteria bacterium]
MDKSAHTNRLIHETSPYLQQHAHNPVDWHPWGPEALERAKREDKPILLSIGYSACHWCHVMEHESFEDEAVAQVMNTLFVNIKVDREERPDLDKIYQTAHQLLTGRPGGWPLNMFLTPTDHMPFFGGTYFPKTQRYSMSAFTDILSQIAGVYRERRADVEKQNAALRDLFARVEPADASAPLGPVPLAAAVEQLKRQFDPHHGGFGGAPKFPHPTSLELLLRHWAHSALAGKPDTEALHAVRFTLQQMALGGLYDQLGGGFCRYSVDERWEIPHFEKMLYDNAQLLPLYADTWLATGEPLFRRVALETGAWVMREMQLPGGGYYSTLDADSEGHEGKFYAWDTEEIKKLLTPEAATATSLSRGPRLDPIGEEWELVEARYGLTGTPNFEGRWHLNVRADTAAIADRFQRTEAEIETALDAARAKLFAAREKRVHPGRDEKILTSWNGMMIRAMAYVGQLLGRQDFVDSAGRAFEFVRAQLWRDDRLLATTKDGKAHLNAYLDDYVHLIDGGLALLQARWRAADLDFIHDLADTVLARFEDKIRGGFYFTSDDHESLLHRPKPAGDDAIPSGNGIAAQVLLKLGHLLGEIRYLDAAERTLTALGGAVAQYPSAHCGLLRALDEHLNPPQTIVLRGTPDALKSWHTRCGSHYAPGRTALAIPADVTNLTGLLAERRVQGNITAYICSGHACQAPVSSFEEFENALQTNEITG